MDPIHNICIIHTISRCWRPEWRQCTTRNVSTRITFLGFRRKSLTDIFRAILSDVSTPENRSKALAHVGIAFAICFCIGPPIGTHYWTQPICSLTTVQFRCILCLSPSSPFSGDLRPRTERLRRTSNPDFGPSCPRNPISDNLSPWDPR